MSLELTFADWYVCSLVPGRTPRGVLRATFIALLCSPGIIGGLIGSGRQRIAAWVSLGVFALLFANAMFRVYLAATAPSHVVIGGGVVGNAAMAAVFATVGIVAWWALRRHAQAESSTKTSKKDEGGV